MPASSDRSIKELFESEEQELENNGQALLPWLQQRDVLFLDEAVQALVVLKTPFFDEDQLKALLKRIVVSVELCATGVNPGGKPNDPRSQQVKDVLSEATVDSSEEPFVVASSLQGSEDEACLFVIWKVHLPLNRPRLKLQKLSVYLAPLITLRPVEVASNAKPGEQLLPSMVPQPINLLQPFEADPRFAGQRPYLSASRITKVAPAAPAPRDSGQRLRTAPKRLFRAGPALFWRIRFSKTTAPPKSSFMFATLEFETPQLWRCDVSVTAVELQLAQGKVQNIGPGLPELLRTGEQYTVLFKLNAPPTLMHGPTSTDKLDINITATAKIGDGCTPTLNIKWTTTADFQFDQHTKLNGTTQAAGNSHNQANGPDSLPYTTDSNLEKPVTPVGPTGVTVTITGPDKIVVGKPFVWHVFIVNRSDAIQSLAIFPISKVSTQERRQFPPAVTPLRPTEQKPGETNDVYDMPISWFFEPTELTCLTSNARVGPLAPSVCETAELKFLAAAPGVIHMQAVRIVDLATRKTWDIVDLPDIVAHST